MCSPLRQHVPDAHGPLGARGSNKRRAQQQTKDSRAGEEAGALFKTVTRDGDPGYEHATTRTRSPISGESEAIEQKMVPKATAPHCGEAKPILSTIDVHPTESTYFDWRTMTVGEDKVEVRTSLNGVNSTSRQWCRDSWW